MQQRKHLFLAGIALASMLLALAATTFCSIPMGSMLMTHLVPIRCAHTAAGMLLHILSDVLLPKDLVCNRLRRLASILHGASERPKHRNAMQASPS